MADPTPTAAAGTQDAANRREDPAALVRDWALYATRGVDGVESFARQKPLAALVAAFVLGLVFNALVSALFRRRS